MVVSTHYYDLLDEKSQLLNRIHKINLQMSKERNDSQTYASCPPDLLRCIWKCLLPDEKQNVLVCKSWYFVEKNHTKNSVCGLFITPLHFIKIIHAVAPQNYNDIHVYENTIWYRSTEQGKYSLQSQPTNSILLLHTTNSSLDIENCHKIHFSSKEKINLLYSESLVVCLWSFIFSSLTKHLIPIKSFICEESVNFKNITANSHFYFLVSDTHLYKIKLVKMSYSEDIFGELVDKINLPCKEIRYLECNDSKLVLFGNKCRAYIYSLDRKLTDQNTKLNCYSSKQNSKNKFRETTTKFILDFAVGLNFFAILTRSYEIMIGSWDSQFQKNFCVSKNTKKIMFDKENETFTDNLIIITTNKIITTKIITSFLKSNY